ncbi:MAG: hypothetical protein SFV18_17155 [Bryobacteraceae bacterium]|nr:hypothetical protein [Bryobacteraceae bacterium]
MRAAIFAIAFGCPVAAADFDPAISRLARAQGLGTQTKILARGSISPELELVVALSGPRRTDWWDANVTLSMYLQSSRDAGSIFKIAAERGPALGDCYARVERIGPSEAVISCTPEKGASGPLHKFVFDARAKALVGHIEFPQTPMWRIRVSRDRATFLSESGTGIVYQPTRVPPLMAVAEERAIPYERPAESKLPVALPQSSYDQFAAARPKRVKNGYTREFTLIEERIGPHQYVDGVLWFGKTFYDGEGITGIGGFGYFDAKTRRYRLFAPPEMADYSATAIRVEPYAIWLALASRGEWSTKGGGILRFDRATERVERWPSRDIVTAFARVGDGLVAATWFGIAALDNGKLRRYFLDKTLDGRWRVVEANVYE